MLCEHRAHQKAAVASTLDRQFFGSCIFFFNQVLGSSRKIVEHVLLFREITGFVPLFAELATASNIRHHINAAMIEPKSSRKIKIRRHADPVTAIAIEQGRVLSVALCSSSAKNVERDSCAVF